MRLPESRYDNWLTTDQDAEDDCDLEGMTDAQIEEMEDRMRMSPSDRAKYDSL